MKKAIFGTLIVSAVLFVLPLVVPAGTTGNGAPSGPHYDLNIIGVSNPKTADMTNSNRHTIFVALGKKDTVTTNIWLTPGPFQVCDGNGFDQATDCNGNPIQVPGQNGNQPGAVFQLPCDTLTNGDVVNPCDTTTTDSAAYSIWARALGTPYGSAAVATCAYDTTGTLVCSTGENVFSTMRSKGKSSFTDVTSFLTTIVSVTLGTSYEIFSPLLQDYFWQYTNSGLKLLQLRFYLIPSS